jgi:hypothetical protein
VCYCVILYTTKKFTVIKVACYKIFLHTKFQGRNNKQSCFHLDLRSVGIFDGRELVIGSNGDGYAHMMLSWTKNENFFFITGR